jgi:AraC-like DNA-binding protein
VLVLGLKALGLYFIGYLQYNRILFEIPRVILVFLWILFFSSLYNYRIRKFTLLILGSIVLIQLFVILYFTVVFKLPLETDVLNNDQYSLLKVIIRVILYATIIAVFTNLFFKIQKNKNESNIYASELRKWTLMVLVLNYITFGLSFSRNFILLKPAAEFLIPIFHFFAILLILFRPKFLNNTTLEVSLSNLFTKKRDILIDEELFINVFFSQVYYLKKDASADDLSTSLQVTTAQLSNYLYSKYNLTYTDMVNKHRVKYFTEFVQTSKYQNQTIDTLAQMSGFTSRHHLYSSFKRFHGGTPSDFIRSVEKG